RLGGIFQLIAFGQETGPFHARRVVGEEAMIARRSRDVAQDLGLAIGDRPARQNRDPAIDIAPRRYAGGPVATPNDAGVEVDRMRHRLELAIAFGALVPFGLQL